MGTRWARLPYSSKLSICCCPESSLPGRARPPFSALLCCLRRNYKALCQMYEKIQPLLENLHGNFTETKNNIGEQREWGGLGREGVDAILVFS